MNLSIDDPIEKLAAPEPTEPGSMSEPEAPPPATPLPPGWTAEVLPNGLIRLIRTVWFQSPTPFSTEWRVGPNLVEERLGLHGRRLVRRFTSAQMTIVPVTVSGYIAYWGLFINDREIDRTGRATRREDLQTLGKFLAEHTGWALPVEP
jgi:hypothetical protein